MKMKKKKNNILGKMDKDLQYLESLMLDESLQSMESVNKTCDMVGNLVTDSDYLKQRYHHYLHISRLHEGIMSLLPCLIQEVL